MQALTENMDQGLKSVNKYDMIALLAYSNFSYYRSFILLMRPDSGTIPCKPLKSYITAHYANKTENKIEKS